MADVPLMARYKLLTHSHIVHHSVYLCL